jgi:hypothetical protein
MIDWMRELTIATYVKIRLAEADAEGLWPVTLPEVAADEDRIAATEALLGHRLDEQYRSFLSYANGWRGILQTIDLFGTRELVGGQAMTAASEFLLEAEHVTAATNCPIDSLLPFAYSEESSDLFVMGRPASVCPGKVLWIGSELIDTFPSFHEFFLAMVDYNRHLLRELETRTKQPDP